MVKYILAQLLLNRPVYPLAVYSLFCVFYMLCYTFVSGAYKNILLIGCSKVFIKLTCLKKINVCLKILLVATRAAKCA